MYRKIISLLLVICTILSLVACGATNNTGNTDNSNNSQNTTNNKINEIKLPEKAQYVSDSLVVADLEIINKFQGKIIDCLFFEGGSYYVLTTDGYYVGDAFDGTRLDLKYDIKARKILDHKANIFVTNDNKVVKFSLSYENRADMNGNEYFETKVEVFHTFSFTPEQFKCVADITWHDTYVFFEKDGYIYTENIYFDEEDKITKVRDVMPAVAVPYEHPDEMNHDNMVDFMQRLTDCDVYDTTLFFTTEENEKIYYTDRYDIAYFDYIETDKKIINWGYNNCTEGDIEDVFGIAFGGMLAKNKDSNELFVYEEKTHMDMKREYFVDVKTHFILPDNYLPKDVVDITMASYGLYEDEQGSLNRQGMPRILFKFNDNCYYMLTVEGKYGDFSHDVYDEPMIKIDVLSDNGNHLLKTFSYSKTYTKERYNTPEDERSDDTLPDSLFFLADDGRIYELIEK